MLLFSNKLCRQNVIKTGIVSHFLVFPDYVFFLLLQCIQYLCTHNPEGQAGVHRCQPTPRGSWTTWQGSPYCHQYVRIQKCVSDRVFYRRPSGNSSILFSVYTTRLHLQLWSLLPAKFLGWLSSCWSDNREYREITLLTGTRRTAYRSGTNILDLHPWTSR